MTAALSAPETVGAEEVHTNLRTALHALASDSRARQSPGRELVRLRHVVDVARSRIDQAAATGGSMAEAHVARVRLMDAGVAGLLRFARAVLDSEAESMIAPVCCVAIGDYPGSIADKPFAGGLLVLLEEGGNRRARGEAMAGFIEHGLTDLGMDIETYAKTVDEAARLLMLPAFDGWLRQQRLIAGQHALFGRFHRNAVANRWLDILMRFDLGTDNLADRRHH
jgi:hypothetical protein